MKLVMAEANELPGRHRVFGYLFSFVGVEFQLPVSQIFIGRL